MGREFKNKRLMFFFVCSCLFPAGVHAIDLATYKFSINATKSTCVLRLNDFPVIDTTLTTSGSISAGYGITPYLENGLNRIELLMGPLDHEDPKTLYPDTSCKVSISKKHNGVINKIASYTLAVDENGHIKAIKGSDDVENAYNKNITEGYTKNAEDYGLYKLSGDLVVSDVPKWSWVDATPVNASLLPDIQKTYATLWSAMKNRDVAWLSKFAKISNEEISVATGMPPQMIFESTDFPGHILDKTLTPLPIEWDDYELVTYRGGRLFRLGVGYYQNSPLKFKNESGGVVFSYNPYFSIINGKITLVR